MVRMILAVIIGVVVGSVFNMAIVMTSTAIFPMAEGASMSDPEAMKAYVAGLPTAAFFLILVAHAGGALVGGFVAGLVGRRAPWVLGAIVGAFFLAGGIYAAVVIPAPMWFVAVDLLSYIPAGLAGAMIATRLGLRAQPTDY